MSGDAFVFSKMIAMPPGPFWKIQRRQVIGTVYAMLAAQVREDYARVSELWHSAEHEQQGYALGLLAVTLIGQGLDDDPAIRRQQVDIVFGKWADVVRNSNPGARAEVEDLLTGVGAVARDILCAGKPVSKVDLPMNKVLREPLAMCLVWQVASMFYTWTDGDQAATLGLLDQARAGMLAGDG